MWFSVNKREQDDRLLKRIARGERQAFDLLMERHVDQVFSLARRVLESHTDAEEVTQEVFLQVWRQAAQWRPGAAQFSTWLYRVTLNRSLSFRDRVRNRYAALEEVGEQADPGAETLDQLVALQRRLQLDQAIAQLPENQRMAMTLNYGKGLSNAEAAEVMQISIKALEGLLVRAKRTLRDALARDK